MKKNQEYLVQRSYRIKTSLLQKLEEAAKETGVSQNELVNKALEEYFNNKSSK